jgi:hypothetical protein
MSQRWKDQYIGWFVADSPVWSGAVLALATITGGGLNFFGNQSDGALCSPLGCLLSKEFAARLPVVRQLPRAVTTRHHVSPFFVAVFLLVS